MERTRVLVVEDYPLLQRLYCELLAQEGSLEVVGGVDSGSAALNGVRALRPDVVLIDFGLPDMNGLEAIRRIKAAAPAVRVVVLLEGASDEYEGAAVASGADACLKKECAATELLPKLGEIRRQVHARRAPNA